MELYRITLSPLTAFGTPIVGDTLFGQLCWTLRHLHGVARLAQLLHGYTSDEPFMILSDAFPQGFVPLPTLPSSLWRKTENADRKALKKKRWLAVGNLGSLSAEWQSLAFNDAEVAETYKASALSSERAQPHNSINRMTGATGKDGFAPYAQNQLWYHPDVRLDVYVLLDESRLILDDFIQALGVIAKTGYGRDASVGLGKFTFEIDAHTWPQPTQISHVMTLAPCAPQNLGFASQRSFYQVQTRFGRHGDAAALGANPFKHPLLMAKTAAVFGYAADQQPNEVPEYIGQGIGGVSSMQPTAVHQGYAPVLGVYLEHASTLTTESSI